MDAQPGITFKNRPYFVNCVQWNDDGQLVVCLDNQVHIVTPLLTGLSSTKDSYTHVGINLPKLEKPTNFSAIEDTKDIQPSALTIEEGFRCANWSPIDLSHTQSCFLVVVTTKHRVLLYQNSATDRTCSDWELYLDLTDRIRQEAIQHGHPTRLQPYDTLYASWSNRLIPDPLATKPALLALSNKAGDLVIFTYSINADFNYVSTTTPHTSFVNFLEWTKWKQIGIDKSVAYVISSSTNGTVAISSVTVNYFVNDDKETMIQSVQVDTKLTWFEELSSIVTFIKSCSHGENQIKIAISKGITVQFICLDIEDNGDLKPKSDWMCYDLENSVMGLASGSWINESEFRCYTVEGEGLQLQVDTDISKSEEATEILNEHLVQRYRQQWMDDQLEAKDDIMASTVDCITYVWGAADGINHIFTAIFFGLKPLVDVHYKGESEDKWDLIFILQKNRGVDQDVDKYVNDVDLFFSKSFRGILREMMEYLVDESDIRPFGTWISKLQNHLDDALSLSDAGLTRAIYSEPSTIAARILIHVEIGFRDFGKNSIMRNMKDVFEQAKSCVQINYVRNILNYALQLPEEQFTKFEEQDITVLLLLADSSLNLGDMSLVSLALQLYLKLKEKYSWLLLNSEIEFATHYKVGETITDIRAREKCPVCDGFVHVNGNALFAQCDTGHLWELCSMTKRVLSKPNTRQCITCGAKSLQLSGDGSMTDIILTNCYKCIICGSGLSF